MRDVFYGAACSLDGFIAGPNGEIDWLDVPASRADDERYLAEVWSSVDTLIMGRKTYEDAFKHGDPQAMGMFDGVTWYVFSRTLASVETRNTHLVRDDAAGCVRELKAQPGKRIWLFGGGEFASAMFGADLVDEIAINVIPVLLGSGVPLFVDPGKRVPLEHAETRLFGGGCVLLRYRVVRV